MCGIHCILDKRPRLTSDEALGRMMQASAYRGPDASGTLRIAQANHTVWLGSHRLQISDPHARADQPFVSPDGRYTLLYNGEIYNYYELRNRLLSQGIRFITQSDTEVLLHWLIRQGTAGIAELNGMFAFVLYDQQKATLWTARDRFGMKPLYYADTDKYLIISSEAKSIVASGLIDRTLREQTVNHYLRFRYSAKETAFYAEVNRVNKGQTMTYRPGTPVQRSFYFQPATMPSANRSEEALVKHTEQQLTEAVLRHWATDVPTGLFLSGGVDSTLLLALLRQEGYSVPTFSLGPTEADRRHGTRDDHFARQAAEQYQAYHREVIVAEADVEEHFDTFIQRTDQPVGDSGAFTTYLLSQKARASVKVVLSGAGADELFGGYHRHQAYHYYLRHYSLFNKARPLFSRLIQRLPTGGNFPGRASVRLLRKLAHDLTDNPTETWSNFVSLSGWRIALNEPYSPDAARPTVTPESDQFVEEYLRYALCHDQQHYLVSDVLAISDGASMAHGLELRLPYLDINLQHTVNRLPATLRLQHGRKWILRRVLESKGGKQYTQRRKEGFGLPFGSWLRNPDMPLIRRYLKASDRPVYRYVPYQPVQQMLAQHQRGRHDYSQELWAALVLAAWLECHFPDL